RAVPAVRASASGRRTRWEGALPSTRARTRCTRRVRRSEAATAPASPQYPLAPWSSSYVTVLFPVVAVALGAILAGELVSAQFLVGAALVMVGTYAGALARYSVLARGAGEHRRQLALEMAWPQVEELAA